MIPLRDFPPATYMPLIESELNCQLLTSRLCKIFFAAYKVPTRESLLNISMHLTDPSLTPIKFIASVAISLFSVSVASRAENKIYIRQQATFTSGKSDIAALLMLTMPARSARSRSYSISSELYPYQVMCPQESSVWPIGVLA